MIIKAKIARASETSMNPITLPPLKATLNAFCKAVLSSKLVAAINVTLLLALVATYIPMYPLTIEVNDPKMKATIV